MPNILKPQTTPQNPYVIVSHPGQADEKIISEFPTLKKAIAEIKNLKKESDSEDGSDDDENFDVMKRQDDGSPTCDY